MNKIGQIETMDKIGQIDTRENWSTETYQTKLDKTG